MLTLRLCTYIHWCRIGLYGRNLLHPNIFSARSVTDEQTRSFDGSRRHDPPRQIPSSHPISNKWFISHISARGVYGSKTKEHAQRSQVGEGSLVVAPSDILTVQRLIAPVLDADEEHFQDPVSAERRLESVREGSMEPVTSLTNLNRFAIYIYLMCISIVSPSIYT